MLQCGLCKHVSSADALKRKPDAKTSYRAVSPVAYCREIAMNHLAGCHDMEVLCRRRATLDHEHSWKWLGQADRWKELAHIQHYTLQPGPMAMGPNTIDGDLHK
jgi:hypothetical protein